MSNVRYQYLATICVNLLSVGYGIIAGWPSAAFGILTEDDAPLETGPLNVEETSWVGSIMCLGGAAGNVFFGWLSERIGRKKPLLLAAVVQAASWTIILIASNPTHLLVARFVAGFSGGGSIVLSSLFVTEIADDRIRGFLGSLMVFHINFGILLAFIIGDYLTYTMATVISLVIPIVFMALFICFPETPAYLMQSGDIQGAENSICFYRNISKSERYMEDSILSLEMQKLSHLNKSESKTQDEPNVALTWSDFNNTVARKALLIGLVLAALNQVCGVFAMINYTSTIFASSGSTLSANTSAIIVGAIQLTGSTCSSLLVEKAGRKFLMIFSSIGTCIGLTSLGTYTYLGTIGFDMTAFGLVPIGSFSVMILSSSMGILTLTFVIMAELMPEKIRAFGTSCCTLVLWILAFTIVKIFPLLSELLGLHGTMFLFATNALAGAIFIITMVPETKGKSAEEIKAILGGQK